MSRSRSDYGIPSPGFYANLLRPIVLLSCNRGESGDSCISGTPAISLHRATVAAIYQHLEDYAEILGEVTDRAREIAAGKFDPPALELSTGDPRFDPDQPIVINGHRFVRDPQA